MYGEFKIEFFSELVSVNTETFEVKSKMNCKITGLMTREMIGAIGAAMKVAFDNEIRENIARAFNEQ